MKKFHIIDDFLDVTSDDFTLSGTSPLDGEQYTMATSADVLEEIEDSFGERAIYAHGNDPMQKFADMWERWLSRRGDQLAAAWQALSSTYEPLQNYNRTEEHNATGEITHGEVITKQMTHAGTDNLATTPAGSTVTTTPGVETRVTVTPAETTETTTPRVEKTIRTTPAETTETTTPGVETTVTTTPAETTETTTPAGTKTTTENSKIAGAAASRTASSAVYAFNSSDAVPVSEGTETDSSKSVATVEPVTDQDGVVARTTDTAGSEVTTKSGHDTITHTTDEAGVEVTSTTGTDTIARTTDTAGSEVTTKTGFDTVQATFTAGSENRTVNLSDTGSDTHSGKDSTKDDLTIHAYGNIGTMSSQDMARQEVELRRKDFVYAAILEFINLYTVYV